MENKAKASATVAEPVADVSNIYKLDGKVPVDKAIPFGLQHVLAMFVSNLAPISIICAAAQPALSSEMLGWLLQNAMFVAGIATLVQIYPIWKIGSKLPVVMGVSFTFVAVLSSVAASYGYGAVVGCVLIGGLFEGILGLLANYWRKLITPIVAASVVTAIGLSLFTVGIRSFGGGYADDFGSAQNLWLGTITLVTCLAWNIFAKGYLKQLNVLAGLIVGYCVAIGMGKVDLSVILQGGWISLPHLMPVQPVFHPGAILSVCIIFLVSAAETIGDTSALVAGGLGRTITGREIQGSLSVDGFGSAFSSFFGTPPVTSFSQNVGLINMTHVVNRNVVATGAGFMILGGLFPPLGNFFASLPQSVLGGCTVMMFGSILVSGMQMIADAGFTQRNITIASLSLVLGAGLTASTELDIWNIFPEIVQTVFGQNVVAVTFVVALVLSLILPKNMDIEHLSQREEEFQERQDEIAAEALREYDE